MTTIDPKSNRDLLNLICEGLTIPQISEKFNVKARTLEMRLLKLRYQNHCTNITQLCVKYTLYAHNVTKNFYL